MASTATANYGTQFARVAVWRRLENCRRRGKPGISAFPPTVRRTLCSRPCGPIGRRIRLRQSALVLHLSIQLAGDRGGHTGDMGVFIISPADKGGMLYRPPAKLVQLCQPLHPLVFNCLFCLSRPEVHTLSVGASQPSDFDLQLTTLELLDQADSLLPPIEQRLQQAMAQAVGQDVMQRAIWRGCRCGTRRRGSPILVPCCGCGTWHWAGICWNTLACAITCWETGAPGSRACTPLCG